MNKVRSSNDRLGSALESSKRKKKTSRRKYAFEDESIWKKAVAIRLSRHAPLTPTKNIRVHEDAVSLCKLAWSNKSERIVETSSLLRKAAKEKLGI